MSALVLSLLVASANTSYDRQSSELKALSANIVLLDRTLELYGPGAQVARDGLRDVVRHTHDRIWSPEGVRPEDLNSMETRKSVKANVEQLQTLSPKTDMERMLQSRAIQESENIAQARLLMFAQLGGSISWAFLTVLVFWISMLFLGFGLFARFNATVTLALLVGALSVAGAIFLILELNDPYRGLSVSPTNPCVTRCPRSTNSARSLSAPLIDGGFGCGRNEEITLNAPWGAP